MDVLFTTIQMVLVLGLPIGGFLLVRRWPHHTRRQLVVAAALGGGIGGAIVAVVATAVGASITDALPFAVLGLVSGGAIGLLGVAAFALGAWLNREP